MVFQGLFSLSASLQTVIKQIGTSHSITAKQWCF